MPYLSYLSSDVVEAKERGAGYPFSMIAVRAFLQ